MEINSKIENLKYKPLLCRPLKAYSLKQFKQGIPFKDASFKIRLNNDELIAVSWWVSSKRTRSYPFTRVYDTLNYQKRITIIPLVKDEGARGDRDYLQWDTVSLMSLLGVYVIIAYYNKAEINPRFKNKITNQEFNYKYLHNKLKDLLGYKSDALHWNLEQLKNIGRIQKLAEKSYYKNIQRKTGVKLHDINSFRKHVKKMSEDVEKFKEFSRDLAKKAQHRESKTVQPKEIIINEKAKITIKNYLGGLYYWTVDEVVIKGKNILLIEKKHSAKSYPKEADIKDALLKLALYTNFNEVKINDSKLKFYPVLGLTTNLIKGYYDEERELKGHESEFNPEFLELLKGLFKEGKKNKFRVFIINSKEGNKQDEIVKRILEQGD